MNPLRVAISPSFCRADGRWNFPGFDIAALASDPAYDVVQLSGASTLRADDVRDFDALILAGDALPATALPIESRLGIVARFGVGYDKVDVAACTAAGVALTITPDAVRRPVAVAALTLVLAAAGKLLIKDRLTREGPAGFATRTDHMGIGLVDRTLASIGLGNIGAEMYRLAKPLGMRHIAHDPWANPAIASEAGVTLVDLATVFREADFLCVHCPLTPQTKHLVNAERIATMKPSAYLINTARGAIVDQRSLEDALERGAIAGAALDVLDPEPPMAESPILRMGNVILAPHALSWTDQAFAAIGEGCIEPVRALARGEAPRNVVNRDVLDTRAFLDKLARRRVVATDHRDRAR
ncbi:MAG TPA: NAD(P)-dependent oxidoreductase [Casimicrobiaceae bacterium]|nr:NAD(P)-dependent oxidoreductase [Casimicrobiaceae bacterium]